MGVFVFGEMTPKSALTPFGRTPKTGTFATLPGLDGLEVCRRVRSRINVPLTVRGEEADRVLGLEGGAVPLVGCPAIASMNHTDETTGTGQPSSEASGRCPGDGSTGPTSSRNPASFAPTFAPQHRHRDRRRRGRVDAGRVRSVASENFVRGSRNAELEFSNNCTRVLFGSMAHNVFSDGSSPQVASVTGDVTAGFDAALAVAA